VPYSCPSPLIRPSAGIYKFARHSLPEGRALLEGTVHLIGRIHREIAFDAHPDDAEPSVEAVLRNKQGSASDLAHLAIACLRSHGLAARLVSGYITARATAGTELRSFASHQAHAWLAVWVPEAGWVDFDPATNSIVTAGYIALAAGRDWRDVNPIRGVLADGRVPRYESEIAITPMADG
jgi:transglutaminase-like putative cysteine protease